MKDKRSIKKKDKDIVICSDGSVWRVDTFDVSKIFTWSGHDELETEGSVGGFDVTLTHLRSKETVKAKRLN